MQLSRSKSINFTILAHGPKSSLKSYNCSDIGLLLPGYLSFNEVYLAMNFMRKLYEENHSIAILFSLSLCMCVIVCVCVCGEGYYFPVAESLYIYIFIYDAQKGL